MPANKTLKYIASAALVLLIAIGIYFRFQNMDWNQGASLHPDEYGLTNTLTQLHFPQNLDDYFNTRLSPLSPYQRYNAAGQAIGDGPDNRLRWGQWPIILIRGLGELTGNTGYDEIRILGRYLSASVDTLSVILILLIGWELYGTWAGLLAGALSALAVMQIQQSHFMTMDTFSAFFSVLAMYAAVKVVKRPPVRVPQGGGAGYVPYRPDWGAAGWFLVFGVSYGMAVASKINLAPLAGLLLVAAFISVADLKLRAGPDLGRIVSVTFLFLCLAGAAAILTFRVTQPMSFRAAQGDTTLLTLTLNPDWAESMNVAQMESSGIGGGPPSEQWASRTPVLYPLMNLVVWGLGAPLGLAAWAGCLLAIWQMLRHRGRGWRSHLLPVVWVVGYFGFMATRFVSSLRYFLPLYPFLCLLAAWGLLELLRSLQRRPGAGLGHKIGRALAFVGVAAVWLAVLGGTLAWATVFTTTVYGQDHTRIQASKWIYQNIPAPFQIRLAGGGETPFIPISSPDGLHLSASTPYVQQFSPLSDGSLSSILIPHILNAGAGQAALKLTISTGSLGKEVLDQATVQVPATPESPRGVEVQGQFQGAALKKGQAYTLTVTPADDSAAFIVFRNIVANESWDEGLPVRFYGWDPFGQFYTGLTMEVRWADNEDKLTMFLQTLSQADYVILPSQRAIWSVSRIPLTYPMTLEYYRALFEGRIGFDLAAAFEAPFHFGPLWVSDLSGQAAWNQPPALPRFNFNPLAAEEAFSVYDHPPVWIFKKGANFNLADVARVLGSVDLSRVVVQGPRDAVTVPIQ